MLVIEHATWYYRLGDSLALVSYFRGMVYNKKSVTFFTKGKLSKLDDIQAPYIRGC